MLPGAKAWENLSRMEESRWATKLSSPGTGSQRLKTGNLLTVAIRPKFAVPAGSRFFCIGSCFARNIEEHLKAQGSEVLSLALSVPKSEWPGRPNGIVNKFTLPSIVQELLWAWGEPASPETIVEVKDGWVDLQLVPYALPVDRERAIERRKQISNYFRSIKLADVIIITLGYVEVWFDLETQIYLNAAPHLWTIKKYPGRYAFSVHTHAQCMADLEQVRALLHAHGKTPRIILTVSPVPLRHTFTGRDIVIANRQSKSTLVSAAYEFARKYEDVDYFPSFEMVTESPRPVVYDERYLLEVRDEVVGEVVRTFLSAYAEPQASFTMAPLST